MPLRDFFRRPAPTPPPAALTAALTELDRLVSGRPELANPARSLTRILRAAFSDPIAEKPLPPEPGATLEAWRRGDVAFHVQRPAIDPEALSCLGLAIVGELCDENPAALELHAAIRRDRGLLIGWWEEIRAGRPDAVERQAGTLGLDPALAASVLRLALLPRLAPYSVALAAVRPAGLWTRGDCPNCGRPPVLAESRGLEQSRYLRCGLCAADWPGERLRCPCCDTTDHRLFHYRYVEGEQDRNRLAVCDGCGFMLKVVATLAPLSPPGLLVTELATIHLDLIADLPSS